MDFAQIIKNLYKGLQEDVLNILYATKPLSLLKELPNEVVHTGFTVSFNGFYNIDILYDPDNSILYSQILKDNKSFFQRYLGLRMCLYKNVRYSPFFVSEDDFRNPTIKYFNRLHENRFCSEINFKLNLDNLRFCDSYDFKSKEMDPELMLDFRDFGYNNYMSLEKALSGCFEIGFDLGNDYITMGKYSLYRYWSDNNVFFKSFKIDEKLEIFLNPAKKPLSKIRYPSWTELAEDELGNLDNDFPGWSQNTWD
jgi:hypothetical protein